MNTTYLGSLPPQLSWGNCNETSCEGMFGPLMTNVRILLDLLASHETRQHVGLEYQNYMSLKLITIGLRIPLAYVISNYTQSR